MFVSDGKSVFLIQVTVWLYRLWWTGGRTALCSPSPDHSSWWKEGTLSSRAALLAGTSEAEQEGKEGCRPAAGMQDRTCQRAQPAAESRAKASSRRAC